MNTRDNADRTGWATVIALIAACGMTFLPGCRDTTYEEPPTTWPKCVAPDRDEYKAEHGIFPDDGAEDLEGNYEGMRHTVLFVFDTSGSMGIQWDHRTKWNVARQAMVDSVSEYQHYLTAGAIFFPTDQDCEVQPLYEDVQISYYEGGGFLDRWDAVEHHHSPLGSTPLNLALQRADEAIDMACDSGVLDRPFKVVLMTDGEPNCDYDKSELLYYPQKWLDQGIETHVIGLPGSEDAEQLLEQLATAGGSELLFLPTTDDEEQTEEDVEDFEDEVDIACE